jgi:hypothetical protein
MLSEPNINDKKPSLIDLETQLWHWLENAVKDAKDPMHTPVVASIGNGLPQLRTVVLRKVLAQLKELRFHTDLRSGKVEELKRQPHIAILGYHPQRRVQLRLNAGVLLEHNNNITLETWQQMRPESKKCYAVQLPPGTTVEISGDYLPLPNNRNWPEDMLESGYPNFLVVRCLVYKAELLLLKSSGHLRCVFNYNKGKLQKSSWLVP